MPTKEVPGSRLEEITLAEDRLILHDKLNILRIVDHDAWWKRGNRDLKGLESEDLLALDEPGEELVSSAKEEEPIPSEGKGIWGFSWAIWLALVL